MPRSKKSSNVRGQFVGFAWIVGHGLAFKVLTDDSRCIICGSWLCLANEGKNNLKLDVEVGAVPGCIRIHSKQDPDGGDRLPTINMFDNPFSVKNVPSEEGESDDDEDPPLSTLLCRKGDPKEHQCLHK